MDQSSTFWTLVGAAGVLTLTAGIGYLLQKQELAELKKHPPVQSDNPPEKPAPPANQDLNAEIERLKLAKNLLEYSTAAENILKMLPKNRQSYADISVALANGYLGWKQYTRADELCEEAFALMVAGKSTSYTIFVKLLTLLQITRPRHSLYELTSYFAHVLNVMVNSLDSLDVEGSVAPSLPTIHSFVSLGFQFSLRAGSWVLSKALFSFATSIFNEVRTQKEILDFYVTNLYQEGKTEEAIRLLSELAEKLDPLDRKNSTWCQERIAGLHFLVDRYDQARKALEQLDFNDEEASARILLYLIYSELGMEEEMRKIETQIRKTDPKYLVNVDSNDCVSRSQYLFCTDYSFTDSVGNSNICEASFVSRPVSAQRKEGEPLSEEFIVRKIRECWVTATFNFWKDDVCESIVVEQEVVRLPFTISTPAQPEDIPEGVHTIEVRIYEDAERLNLKGIHRQFLMNFEKDD